VARARLAELAGQPAVPVTAPGAGAFAAAHGSALPEDANLPPGTLAGGHVLTGAGWLELLEVQSEGRAPQPFAAWARGAHAGDGEVLGG
jgi:hypothetical protein